MRLSPSADSRGAVDSYWRKYVHEVLVNRLGGLSLPWKSVVRLTETFDVNRGRKNTIQRTTIQQRLKMGRSVSGKLSVSGRPTNLVTWLFGV